MDAHEVPADIVRLLDAAQRAVVAAPPAASLLVQAGAGSGKTRTLQAVVAQLLLAGCTVRAFSHANRTVDELKARLAAHPLTRPVADQVTTMHAWAGKLLRAAGVVCSARDFEASLRRAAEGLESGALRCAESHVIVDEAQDLSDLQNRIVAALQQAGVHVYMVGDGEQAIYGFQGASPLHLRRFGQRLPPERRFALPTNYRAQNLRLLELANAVAGRDIRAGLAVEMRPCARAGPGPRPRLVGYRRYGLADAAVAEVRRLQALAAPGAPASVCVLAHTNAVLESIHVALLELQIQAALHRKNRAGEFRRLPARLRAAGVVQLLTIHGAKGGEYEHVLLATGEDRGDSAESEDEAGGCESRRLLYVACTRARQSLTLLTATAERQPCRWLQDAWRCLDVGPLLPFTAYAGEAFVSPTTVAVTALMDQGGDLGMDDVYADPAAARLGATCAVDLALEGEPGELPWQMPAAYGLGLELYVGRLFEHHAMRVLDAPGLASRAAEVAKAVARIGVNAPFWQYATEQPSGRAWWRSQAAHVVAHLHAGLLHEGRGAGVAAHQRDCDVLATCTDAAVRDALRQALNTRGIYFKFSGFPKVFQALLQRLGKLAAAAERRDLAFDEVFRRWERSWDGKEPETAELRPAFEAAFGACLRVKGGSAAAADLAQFAALEAFWAPIMQDQRGGRNEGKQALLHLAQPAGRPTALRAGDARLSAEAVRLLEADARRIVQLLGPALHTQEPTVTPFACRSGAADAGRAAKGCVAGRVDVTLADGCLEIKALKWQIELKHAAQALWYAVALRRPRAYLWDVYRRRLYVWRTPLECREAFLTRCLERYLMAAAPPGCSARVWPQSVALEETPGAPD